MTHPDPVVIPDSGVPEVEQEPRHDHKFGVHCRPECPRWLNPVPQPGWETPQDWLFTFGADHTHPDTGQRLGKSYIRIHGTCDSTRTEMLAAFGNRWSFQYPSAEKAGVEKYQLTEVPMPGADFEQDVARHAARVDAERPANQPANEPANLPVTPAEERTGASDGWREVAHEVAFLRAEIMTGWWEVDTDGRDQALARLDRIEQLARGEQR